MSKKVFCLIGFILAKFVLQYLLLSPEYDLQRDEYLHLDQANHLDWGYVSVPPVTSWIALISKWLGNSPLIIRFFPAFFGSLTLLVVWKIVEAWNRSKPPCWKRLITYRRITNESVAFSAKKSLPSSRTNSRVYKSQFFITSRQQLVFLRCCLFHQTPIYKAGN